MWRCRTTSRVSTGGTDNLTAHIESCSRRPSSPLYAGGALGLPPPSIARNLSAAVRDSDSSAQTSGFRPGPENHPLCVFDRGMLSCRQSRPFVSTPGPTRNSDCCGAATVRGQVYVRHGRSVVLAESPGRQEDAHCGHPLYNFKWRKRCLPGHSAISSCCSWSRRGARQVTCRRLPK